MAKGTSIKKERESCSPNTRLMTKRTSMKKKEKRKTKFEELMELETKNFDPARAEKDLELERKLAKKLKVKKGKLLSTDDGLNDLFDGFPSAFDSINAATADDDGKIKYQQKRKKKKSPSDDDDDNVKLAISVLKKNKAKKKKSDMSKSSAVAGDKVSEAEPDDVSDEEPKMKASVKYVAPHLRACANKESEELSQIRRRVRGLLNRLSESNVESVTEEVATIFRTIGRSVGCQMISEEVLASCSQGPRGNEQYAAVFAAFIAGLACLVGIDFSAKLIASLAKLFEDEYSKEDGLSLRNLTLLLSYMCIFDVCSSDLIYDLLSELSKRLTEMDVSTILTILQCCGMKLRGDDPIAMKDFVLGIQSRVNEANSLAEDKQDGKPKLNSKRMEFMLETICDIKNNKRRSKEEPSHHARIKKWLQKVRAEDILLRGLKWNKLLDPQKKGQWWLSGEITSKLDNVEEMATTISKEVLEAQKLVQLAASQRMNTDVRRAIFCIIMSGEDYMDAFEKILRLDLSGKQDREIMRVLVECCLQEKLFNKYYTVLASKLCSHEKNHKFTLQYCIWDHYKELDSMELNRSINLAKFVAEMLSSFSLSLAVLKTIGLVDHTELTPRRIMHLRRLMEAIFENKDALVWNIFTRVAVAPELEDLRSGLVFFIKKYVVATKSGKKVAGKFKISKKALQNVAGVLM